MESMKLVMITVMMMVGCLAMSTLATTKLYKVGGPKGWTVNVNYAAWSSDHHFYVGDWLAFDFDVRYYNALEVNQTSFESCNDRGFLQNITRSGRDIFQLTEARHYYFLSSKGYCYQGMKLDVLVVNKPRKHRKSGSPSLVANLVYVVLALWGVIFYLFN